jgi:hypothetical protein
VTSAQVLETRDQQVARIQHIATGSIPAEVLSSLRMCAGITLQVSKQDVTALHVQAL